MSKLHNTAKNIRAKVSIAILITAAVLMMSISGIQYYSAHKEIRDNLEKNAEMELVIKTLNIRQTLAEVELALQNHRLETERSSGHPREHNWDRPPSPPRPGSRPAPPGFASPRPGRAPGALPTFTTGSR